MYDIEGLKLDAVKTFYHGSEVCVRENNTETLSALHNTIGIFYQNVPSNGTTSTKFVIQDTAQTAVPARKFK